MKKPSSTIHPVSEETLAAHERWYMDQDPLIRLNKTRTKHLEAAFAILAEEDDHFSHQ